MKGRDFHMNYDEKKEKVQAKALSQEIAKRLEAYLAPLVVNLTGLLDKRLVRTFVGLIEVIISFRGYRHGLLLSELGGYLMPPGQAPAGTKRLSNLLHGLWSYKLIEQFLWQGAKARVAQLEVAKEKALFLWDESVWEKPESLKLEALGSARSSKAKRLTRIKPGYYHPPGKPIFVPGMNWLGVLLVGMKGVPCLVKLRWWTNRGKFATDRRSQERHFLKTLAQFKQRGIHVFDQGFASAAWLFELQQHKVLFILRWRKDYKLIDTLGRHLKAWQLVRGKRSVDHRQVWDARRRCERTAGLYYTQVTHPETQQVLWLIVSRMGNGRSPWYILTNQPITCHEDAWQIIFAYTRRWQIEMAWRFAKSELAFESPRLWKLHTRLKLLFIATLAFAFLLLLLLTDHELVQKLLRLFCHRTGKKLKQTKVPLYRLRSALARLWLSYLPSFTLTGQSSG
jgi:hypothetical protein